MTVYFSFLICFSFYYFLNIIIIIVIVITINLCCVSLTEILNQATFFLLKMVAFQLVSYLNVYQGIKKLSHLMLYKNLRCIFDQGKLTACEFRKG